MWYIWQVRTKLLFFFINIVIALGSKSVGKTSLIDRYISNFYIENHLGTIGMDIRSKILEINDH